MRKKKTLWWLCQTQLSITCWTNMHINWCSLWPTIHSYFIWKWIVHGIVTNCILKKKKILWWLCQTQLSITCWTNMHINWCSLWPTINSYLIWKWIVHGIVTNCILSTRSDIESMFGVCVSSGSRALFTRSASTLF